MERSSRTVTLWTAQRKIVLDTLEREGVYLVKRSYVEEKYQETAWIFQEAYSFFRENAPALLPRPAGAESPVWLYQDPQWAGMSTDTLLLRMEIPVEQALFFDLRLWNRILNLEYLGESPQEEAAFAGELERLGLRNTIPLFQTPFYLVQKRRVRQSWRRLFSADLPQETYRQAAVWTLRREWLADKLQQESSLHLDGTAR